MYGKHLLSWKTEEYQLIREYIILGAGIHIIMIYCLNIYERIYRYIMKKTNIILIGFMGCGKTSVGTKLAKVFDYEFLDTDAMIEEEQGITISEIFETKGEPAFRDMETEMIKKIAKRTSCVFSTGGGLPMRDENAELLKQAGLVIFLKTSVDTTLERLKGDTTRPLLQGDNVREKVEELMGKRMAKYEAAAEHVIVCDDKSFYEIIKEVEDIMKNRE